MASLGPQSPTSYDTTWTDASAATADGGMAASTSTINQTNRWWTYDLSSIPAGSTIDGIVVRLDALKDTTNGDGTLTLTVDLSWNGGTSWTSTKVTSAITTSEVTYTLGGAADTWGRTWTTSELSNFRVRVKATGSGIFDVPAWLLDWVPVTIYYTAPLSIVRTEALAIADGAPTLTIPKIIVHEDLAVLDGMPKMNHLRIVVAEQLAVTDQAGAAQSSAPQVGLGGGALDELLGGGLNFQEVTEALARHEALSATIVFPGSTFEVLQLGDAPLYQDLGASGANLFQPAMNEWGDLYMAASFGQTIDTIEAVLRIQNRELAGSVGGVRNLGTILRGSYLLGASVYLSAWAKDATTWYSKILFAGRIYSAEEREGYVEIVAIQTGLEEKELPVLSVENASFTWGADEGRRPRELGKPIPIGYGRFDVTAIENFATTHPFYVPETGSVVFERASAAYLPALIGVKIPMLPATLAADQYIRKNGTPSSVSTLRQLVYLHGDLSGSPAIEVRTEEDGVHLTNLAYHRSFFGVYGQPDPDMSPTRESLEPRAIFSWDNDSNRAVAFVKDESSDVTVETWRGAGDLRAMQSSLTDGTAKNAAPIYVNSRPIDAQGFELANFIANAEAIAIPFHSLSTIFRTSGGVSFGTTNVTDAVEALNPDPSTFALLNGAGARLSLQLPRGWPPRGGVLLYRFCWITDTSSTATDVRAAFRHSWNWRHGVHSEYGTANITSPIGTVSYDPTTQVFGSCILKPRIEPKAGGSNALRDRFVNEWEFISWDDGLSGGDPDRLYPGDLVLYQVSGGTCKIIHAWFEVVYQSGFDARDPNSTVRLRAAEGFRYFYGEQRLQNLNRGRTSRLPVERIEPAFGNDVYIVGRGPRDDGSGTYTGIPNSLVENPADIAGHLIRKYLGSSEFSNRAQSTAFGSFTKARDLLTAHIARTQSLATSSGASWSNLFTAYVDDTAFASTTTLNAAFTGGFGTWPRKQGKITGVEIRIDAFRTGGTGTHTLDVEISRTGGGTWSSVKATPALGTTEQTYRLGGRFDTWGLSITPADLPNLVVRVTARGSGGSPQWNVEYLECTVFGGEWRLTLPILDRLPLRDYLDRIGGQAMGFVQSQIADDTSITIFRMFVDTPRPSTDDAGRMYRAGAHYFRWKDIARGTFNARTSSLQEIGNAFILRYGYHLPSGEFTFERTVSEAGGNLGGQNQAHVTACLMSQQRYGVRRELVFEAPDVWSHEVADALLRWHVAQAVNRRTIVEFDTFVNGVDLRPGHVIRIDDEIGDRVQYPGLSGAAEWSSHEFTVEQVTIAKDPGGLVRTSVVARECYDSV